MGADVPFCLVGGRARVTGVGEVVEPLAFEERTFTILIPPLELPTAEVYRAWDHLGGPAGGEGNDLEPAALALEPEVARWRDRLGDATGLTPRAIAPILQDIAEDKSILNVARVRAQRLLTLGAKPSSQ